MTYYPNWEDMPKDLIEAFLRYRICLACRRHADLHCEACLACSPDHRCNRKAN